VALPRRDVARLLLPVSIVVLEPIVSGRSSQDEAEIRHRPGEDSLAGIRLNIKYDSYSMPRVDTLITVSGIFDVDNGEFHPWSLHRALGIGMGTPYGEVEFRRAFCYMATGTLSIVRLRPTRMRLQVGRRGRRIPKPLSDVTRAAGGPMGSSPVIVRFGSAGVTHGAVADILREFHR
jgi:hypothetical protein